MTDLMDLLRTVPPEALLFLLLFFLAGILWLILALRGRLGQRSAGDGWRRLEERAQELKRRRHE